MLLELGDPWKNMGTCFLWDLFRNPRGIFKKDELGVEIAQIAIPAALALAADPIASLVDTAFIGHIGPVELAAVGISIAIMNQASKIAIFPLISVTTSFVAEENVKGRPGGECEGIELVDKRAAAASETEYLVPLTELHEEVDSKGRVTKKHISSASSALITGGVLGLIQAVSLVCTAKPLLSYMGVKSDSPMMKPALRYLTLRSLGAPAVLLSLAVQGVFRGLKDTKTPLYATVFGDMANIMLDLVFIFLFDLGVSGAAIAHVISQYLISLMLMWKLMEHICLVPPSIKDLQLSRFLKNGLVLLLRTVAATFCVTLAASMATQHGTTVMAAFQICMQVWLATSLLADGLAVAAQAILADSFARHDYDKVVLTTSRILQMSLVLGLVLCAFVTIILQFSSALFTTDANVLRLIKLGIPFVALTQPINSLAFTVDGLNYGASDFAYSAYSMVSVSFLSVLCLFTLSSTGGFVGIWAALSIFMILRAAAGFLRIGTRTGPWCFFSSV